MIEGLTFSYEEKTKTIYGTLSPDDVADPVKPAIIHEAIAHSEYAKCYIYEEGILDLVAEYNEAVKNNTNKPVKSKIAQRRDSKADFRLSDDNMSASLTITAPYGGRVYSTQELVKLAKKEKIVKGLSSKRVSALLDELTRTDPGETVSNTIAIGLPPRPGRQSKLVPLVPNALERVLKPQVKKGGKAVDMRNLGDVICVKTGTHLLKRLPPTKGRQGYTVKNDPLLPDEGDWQPIPEEKGTKISPTDNNILVATISGMPKFEQGKMYVDDTFTCNGVNVGVGNVKYDGAVLVNGDVTENMQVTASGDITINGFLESGTVKAGGDIIVTEGAMGKAKEANVEHSCILSAGGSIHIQHGQGLQITCKGNVSIGRQLAYSDVNCGGNVFVGQEDNPSGNIFACNINAKKQVKAGTLGAVSGSNLSIDFSHGFNMLLERRDTMLELLSQLRRDNARHKSKLDTVKNKKVPKEIQQKLSKAWDLFDDQSQFLNWLEIKCIKLKEEVETYQEKVGLFTSKRLYPGVVVKLNNKVWRAEREYAKAKIYYEQYDWHYDPLI